MNVIVVIMLVIGVCIMSHMLKVRASAKDQEIEAKYKNNNKKQSAYTKVEQDSARAYLYQTLKPMFVLLSKYKANESQLDKLMEFINAIDLNNTESDNHEFLEMLSICQVSPAELDIQKLNDIVVSEMSRCNTVLEIETAQVFEKKAKNKRFNQLLFMLIVGLSVVMLSLPSVVSMYTRLFM